ncbi:hypothetical protein [Erythrobacter sp. JK5]|uniref:hypothetical protein n=1 Tax=Erythrobacter sp. JK5 TaxID=2829500 RepID=UPI001BAC7E32|nr:hypothetical protein [Erythrobacter sp. JK5]QUL37939.1 hypothetical protein KDC96_00425 [Erythrobacter sp. JK5]
MNIKDLKIAGSLVAAIAFTACAPPSPDMPVGDTIESAGRDEPDPIQVFDPERVVVGGLGFDGGEYSAIKLGLYSPGPGPVYLIDSQTGTVIEELGESWFFDRVISIKWTQGEEPEYCPSIEVRAEFYVGAGPTAAQNFEVAYLIQPSRSGIVDVRMIEE